LVSWAKEKGVRIDLALYLDVREDVALQRVSLRSNEGGLETQEHYRTRVLTYLEQRDQFAAIVDCYAQKSFAIDTSDISVKEVKLRLLEFVASNF